jgi:UDP-N-acetyl-D-mannosaminuronic acid dehydrogenase
MENTYRDVNIAVANEFSRLADRFGVNLWEAIELANQHPRVQILTPGAGVGGHCIGVDPWFLAEAAPDLTPLIQTARQVNDSQPQFVVDLVRGALGGSVVGRRITALGLAYKPNVDDLRESPAVEVCRLLSNEGCHVTTFEPYRPGVDFPGMNKASTFEEAVKNAEAVLCLVRHDQFVNLDPDTLREITSARIAVDVVNAWEPAPWKEVGYQFVKMGDGNPIR